MVALVLSLMSLGAEYSQWLSLCKDVRSELQIAVRDGIISEKEANGIIVRCRRYEERQDDK